MAKKSKKFLVDLKGLILKYQQTNDREVFSKILIGVDGLIINTIIKLKRQRKYLRRVENQELYQVGVVALYSALAKIPETEVTEKIPAWIVAYIKSHVLSTFYYMQKEIPIGEIKFGLVTPPVDYALYMVKSDYQDIVSSGVITEAEDRLLRDRFFNDRTLKEIANDCGLTDSTISEKILRITSKIQLFIKRATIRRQAR